MQARGSVSLLRGNALRAHLRALSSTYCWPELVGRPIEVFPKSVTKRKKAPRNGIFQTPVRHIELQDEAASPGAAVFKPSPINFLAGLSDSEEEQDGGSNDISRLSSSFARSVGILEYVPAPRPIKVGAQDRAPTSSSGATTPAAAAKPSGKAKGKSGFVRERQELARALFAEYNASAFRSCLPADLPIRWNKRLLTTAGITKLRLVKDCRLAAVELSEKVLDDVERLRSTLLHELCHAAAWVADGERRPPHGRCFWRWAKIVSNAVPDVNITTCHSYLIHKPFKFKCSNPYCGVEYSRHSKSIDTEAHRCGACRSAITFQGKFDANGTPRRAKPVATGAFSLFVKENFAVTRTQLEAGASSPNASPTKRKAKAKTKVAHGDVMQALAALYKQGREGREAVTVLGKSPLINSPLINVTSHNSLSNPIIL